jgi:dihydrofolate reductase
VLVGLIACTDRNGLIGIDGKIPWNSRGDLIRFKRITYGKTVIMGRLTFESLGSKPLPGRFNIIVTSNQELLDQNQMFPNKMHCTSSLVEAFQVAKWRASDEVWFAGGGHVYDVGMQFAEFMDISILNKTIDVPDGSKAVYFPEITEHNPVDVKSGHCGESCNSKNLCWIKGPLLPHPHDSQMSTLTYTASRKARTK